MKTDLKKHLMELIKAVADSNSSIEKSTQQSAVENCVIFTCNLSENGNWIEGNIANTVIVSLIGIVAVGAYVYFCWNSLFSCRSLISQKKT